MANCSAMMWHDFSRRTCGEFALANFIGLASFVTGTTNTTRDEKSTTETKTITALFRESAVTVPLLV